jgi:hypothetical protein
VEERGEEKGEERSEENAQILVMGIVGEFIRVFGCECTRIPPFLIFA